MRTHRYTPLASRIRLTWIGIVFVVITVGAFLARAHLFSFARSSELRSSQPPVSPTPTPFPFAELTIPHLQNRAYTGMILEKTKTTETGTYTGYLASYRSDNHTIYGFLTIPKNRMPEEGFPAVVFVHGYIPPHEYKTLENYSAYVDYLASHGLAVFKIDLRGHGDSEGEAGGAYYSGDYIIDTLNAHAALSNENFVDKNRVFLWGHSMGGNVVFRAMAVKPDIPKIVLWAGAVYTYEDFRSYRIQDTSYMAPSGDTPPRRRRQELFDTYGEFDPDSAFWKQVPATNYLKGIAGEIQIHHAVNDRVVSIGYSRNLASILERSGIPFTLYEYTDGGHNINGQSFSVAMERTVKFFTE